MKEKKALVLGAGGFIGSHLVKRLKSEGFWVRGVDLKAPQFSKTKADEFIIGDLRDQQVCFRAFDKCFDEVYQLAADMGGADYIFTGDHDAYIMHNSALINLNILSIFLERHPCHFNAYKRIFFSSSACIYPEYNQQDAENPKTAEASALPAQPDSEYGWEKLFSERLYLAFNRNYGANVCIGRYHNIFGPEGSWFGGREKVPAALCRKIAKAGERGEIEIWGDGQQTRSFLYIDECLEGTLRLMRSNYTGPFNIGSDEMVTINELAEMIMGIAGKRVVIKHTKGPLGVRGRTSDNELIYKKLNWKPTTSLIDGLRKTYPWVLEQVEWRKTPEGAGVATWPEGYY